MLRVSQSIMESEEQAGAWELFGGERGGGEVRKGPKSRMHKEVEGLSQEQQGTRRRERRENRQRDLCFSTADT